MKLLCGQLQLWTLLSSGVELPPTSISNSWYRICMCDTTYLITSLNFSLDSFHCTQSFPKKRYRFFEYNRTVQWAGIAFISWRRTDAILVLTVVQKNIERFNAFTWRDVLNQTSLNCISLLRSVRLTPALRFAWHSSIVEVRCGIHHRIHSYWPPCTKWTIEVKERVKYFAWLFIWC
jgi:hypothetical protein